jgi:hypothetical protein
MIARSFRSLAWVAAIGLAALGCYMLSLRVAAERAELAQLDQRIQTTRQHIRSLQTELGTRGRLQQLEEWNADVLALSAPSANQFLDSQVMLARFDTGTPSLGDGAEVRLASAEAAPTAPRPDAPQAAASVRLAVARAPIAPQAGQPMVHRASYDLMPAAAPKPAPRAATPPPAVERPARPAARRPAAAPVRIAAAGTERRTPLLGADTLRAISRTARAERRGGLHD